MEQSPFVAKTIFERWTADKPLAVGVYAMKHMGASGKFSNDGTLVRVDREVAPGSWSVQYVQLHPEGYVFSGGGSSAWETACFRPITDPVLLLAAEAFECDRQAKEAERVAKVMHHERMIRLAAMSALRATR